MRLTFRVAEQSVDVDSYMDSMATLQEALDHLEAVKAKHASTKERLLAALESQAEHKDRVRQLAEARANNARWAPTPSGSVLSCRMWL